MIGLHMPVADASFWTSFAAVQVAIASFVVSALTLYLSRRRRVQITAEWEARMFEGLGEPVWGIRVYVQNEGTRPVQLQEVGVVYSKSGDEVHRVAGAGREGIGQIVTDGQSGEIWFMAGGAALEEAHGPRTNVFVRVSGKEYFGPFPPEPSEDDKKHPGFRL